MSVSIPRPLRPKVIYPDSDGQPLAENTLQFEWIVTIKEGLDALFADRTDVFVAGDLLWYPVEGDPKIRSAPDAMVAFGRPKGYRGSYIQWSEGGIPPQVVFEVLSPGNRPNEMLEKFRFYERYGVEEYYLYDPDNVVFAGWMRRGETLEEIPQTNGWTSPRLQVRFNLTDEELEIIGFDGRRFLTYLEVVRQRDQIEKERNQVAHERDQVAKERDQVAKERDQLAQTNQRLHQQIDKNRISKERLAAQLRALRIEPDV
jgi:Uma2 family endonuclease